MKVNKLLAIFVVLLGFIVFSKQGFAYTQMVLDPVRNGDTCVTGIAATGSEVYVEVNGEIVGQGEGFYNEFYVEVPKLYYGDRIKVYYLINGTIYQAIEGPVKRGEAYSSVSTPGILYRPSTTSGYIEGFATKGNKVYAYIGSKRIGYANVDKYGSYRISISPQKFGSVIRLYQVNKYGKKSKSFYTTVELSSSVVQKQTSNKKYSYYQQYKITKEFLKWAGERAKIGNMAVTDIWFSHGAGGRGDWFADTPHGSVQLQDLNRPGYYGFKIHALGGVAFYKPTDYTYGISKDAYKASTAEGYSKIARNGTYINKYMLADNGIVYEIKLKKEFTTFTSGAGEYNEYGRRGTYIPDVKYLVSKDTAAQKKYKQILAKYK